METGWGPESVLIRLQGPHLGQWSIGCLWGGHHQWKSKGDPSHALLCCHFPQKELISIMTRIPAMPCTSSPEPCLPWSAWSRPQLFFAVAAQNWGTHQIQWISNMDTIIPCMFTQGYVSLRTMCTLYQWYQWYNVAPLYRNQRLQPLSIALLKTCTGRITQHPTKTGRLRSVKFGEGITSAM